MYNVSKYVTYVCTCVYTLYMHVQCIATCITFLKFFYFNVSGCVRGLPKEGMPMFRHNEIRGNLYIRIDVNFPEDQFNSEDDLKVGV